MHSSRMRTICCSGRLLGGGCLASRLSAQGGCLPRGRGYAQGGSAQGGCLPRGRGYAQGGSAQGGSAQGGCLPRGRGYAQGGGVCPGGLPGGVFAWGCLPDPPPRPVDKITDACENITFPHLLLRTVIIRCSPELRGWRRHLANPGSATVDNLHF